jgi:hypothetical protein
MTGEFFIIEQEGYYLTLYEGYRKMNSIEKEYEWKAMVKVSRE